MSKKQTPKLDETFVFISLKNDVDVDIERDYNTIEHGEKLLKFIQGLSIKPNQKKKLHSMITACVYAYETNSFKQGFDFGLAYPSYFEDEFEGENEPACHTLIS